MRSGDSEALDRAISGARNCSVVLLETPANPTLIMTDIERAAESASRHPDKPVVMVDNTFLGPAFQHPLLLGADVSLYSGTKYLSGFSDMLAGVAITRSTDLIQKIRSRRNMFGNILQPDECWTLEQPAAHGVAAHEPAEQERPAAGGGAGRPQAVEQRHLSDAVSAIPSRSGSSKSSAPIRAGCSRWNSRAEKPAAFDFLRNLHIAKSAVSLGGVETLTCHPKSTTHSGMTADELAESGVTDGLVRISVGIEDWRDLLADFEQALAAIG